MKKRMNQGYSIWIIMIALSSLVLFTSCSEDEIEPEVPEDSGMELPSKFYNEWKNEEGEVVFTISSNQIQYNGLSHNYTPQDVTETGGIYLIALADIKFYISEGANANEIFIGTSRTLSIYYKEVEIENPVDPVEAVNLPDEFNGHWYKEDGYSSSSYFIADDHIKTAGVKFYYAETDVTKNSNAYTVIGTSENNAVYTFNIEAIGDKLKIDRNGEGVKTYWDTPAVELPSSIFTVWYNYDGALTYIIDSNQGNPYINSGNTRYYFGARNVVLGEGDVFQVIGESSSNIEKSFFLKVENDNELSIAGDANTEENFIYYWNNTSNIPFLSEDYYKKWFEVGASTFTYRIYVNNNGNNIVRDRSNGSVMDLRFDPEKGDITKVSDDVYKIVAEGGGVERTFFLKTTTDRNLVKFSVDNSTSYNSFYNGTGLSIERVDYEGGYFQQESGDEWREYKNNGIHHATFTLVARDDWSVRIRKSDGAVVQLDMWTRKINIQYNGSGAFNFLYNIDDWFVD